MINIREHSLPTSDRRLCRPSVGITPALLVLLAVLLSTGLPAQEAGLLSVMSAGARGDGTTDDSAAMQKALDQIAQAGGKVALPPGRYRVAGSLRIPPGVTLQGAEDAPVWSEPLTGSVILATGGRDKEDAPALFEMGHSSAVRGLTVWYPEQRPNDIHPYPWTFHLQGHDNTVENATLINISN